LIVELESAQPLPAVPTQIDTGTPADLLRRRPDIAAAEAAFADSRTRSATAAVALYQALAGGWPQHEMMRRTASATKD
jgi:outer membrane protein, multidrug efflux system